MFLAAAAVALAALALAVTATARDGADDPPGEHREHAQGEAGDDRGGDSRRGRDRDGDRLPDRWERRHGLSPRVKQTHRDPDRDQLDNLGELRRHTNPRDHDTDDDGIDDGEDRDRDEDRDEDELEFSGTILSFADGILTIRASSGQTVTGQVTDATRISCEAERAASREGDDNSGSSNSGSGSGSNSGSAASGSGSGHTDEGDGSNSGPGPNSGPGREGDRRPDVPCGREVLVAGARVDEAELHSSPSGAVFTEVELDR